MGLTKESMDLTGFFQNKRTKFYFFLNYFPLTYTLFIAKSAALPLTHILFITSLLLRRQTLSLQYT